MASSCKRFAAATCLAAAVLLCPSTPASLATTGATSVAYAAPVEAMIEAAAPVTQGAADALETITPSARHASNQGYYWNGYSWQPNTATAATTQQTTSTYYTQPQPQQQQVQYYYSNGHWYYYYTTPAAATTQPSTSTSNNKPATAPSKPSSSAAGTVELTFSKAPVGKANGFILNTETPWEIEEELGDGKPHFQVLSDPERKGETMLQVTLHSADGDGNTKKSFGQSDRARQEIKSATGCKKWTRKLPAAGKTERWVYDLSIKLDNGFTHGRDRFYHLFQLKFEPSRTPLATIGTRSGKFGMYVALSKDKQEFVPFGPLSAYVGKWLNVQLTLDAKRGPGACIQAKVSNLNTGATIHSSAKKCGSFDWNDKSDEIRTKIGQYRSTANEQVTNTVYYKHVSVK